MSEIKREDLDAVAAKLEQFAEGLPEQEKRALGWLMARAQAASAEMTEENLDSVSGGLADVSGMTSDAEQQVDVRVGWAR